MHKRPLVELSQTTYARTLRRDAASLDVPYTVRGRAPATRDPSGLTRALAWFIGIALSMSLATLIAIH